MRKGAQRGGGKDATETNASGSQSALTRLAAWGGWGRRWVFPRVCTDIAEIVNSTVKPVKFQVERIARANRTSWNSLQNEGCGWKLNGKVGG